MAWKSIEAELLLGSQLWQIPTESEDETQTAMDHMIKD